MIVIIVIITISVIIIINYNRFNFRFNKFQKPLPPPREDRVTEINNNLVTFTEDGNVTHSCTKNSDLDKTVDIYDNSNTISDNDEICTNDKDNSKDKSGTDFGNEESFKNVEILKTPLSSSCSQFFKSESLSQHTIEDETFFKV